MLSRIIYNKPVGKRVERKLNEFIKSENNISQFELINHLGDLNIYTMFRNSEGVMYMYKNNPYGKEYVYIFKICRKIKNIIFPKGKMIVYSNR